jgi:hypothetical protein
MTYCSNNTRHLLFPVVRTLQPLVHRSGRPGPSRRDHQNHVGSRQVLPIDFEKLTLEHFFMMILHARRDKHDPRKSLLLAALPNHHHLS